MVSWISWIIDRISVLHRWLGIFNIWLSKLLSGRTRNQLIALIVLFTIVFFVLQFSFQMDDNSLFKGMTTYDFDSRLFKNTTPIKLKIIYIVGVTFFSGFLVMVLTNGVRNNIEKIIAGDVRYRFYDHIIIFGYNDIAEGVLDNLLNKNSRRNIVVVVENKVRDVREKIEGKYGSRDNLFVLHGNRTSGSELKTFYPNKAFEIFIIGEDEINSDFKGLDCYNELRQIENFSKWEAYIYLYLNEQSSITLINNRRYNNESFKDIEDDNHRLKIYNTDERWARRILVDSSNQWPKMNVNMRNGIRITMDSDIFVHLIIIGMTGAGEAIATTAAKTCHHPNFVTRGIRTKITIIDNDFTKNRGLFNGRYYDFMAMCHYTIRKIQNNTLKTIKKHTPNEEMDFLDIEWNFIEANPDDARVCQELIEYVQDKSSLLSVFVCGNNEQQNVNIALGLPKVYYDEAIPVWLYVRSDSSLRNYLAYSRYDNIVTWGMPGDCPTKELWEEAAAKELNLIIEKMYMSERENEEYNKEQIWEKLPVEKRSATIDNAAAIPIFVGSMTHWSKDSSEIELSDDEKAVFTEMEHVRWCVCSLIRGYRPINLKKINPGDNYWSYYNNLRKQFYNEYICKFDEMKDRQMGLLESELIQFYKQIIFKQL